MTDQPDRPHRADGPIRLDRPPVGARAGHSAYAGDEPAAGPAAGPIRVLVVDDSATVRAVLRRHLEADPRCVVVGVARDGVEALAQVRALRPDVVTLDVEMPRMDGLATLRRLMADDPLPVVMVSSLTSDGAAATIEALEVGAVDFYAKPMIGTMVAPHQIGTELVAQVCAAATVSRARLRAGLARRRAVREQQAIARGAADVSRAQPPAAPTGGPPAGPGTRPSTAGRPPAAVPPGRWRNRVVVIASSTGGPQALREVITRLPADLHVPVVVVQHMPPGFTASLAQRLDGLSAVDVVEAGAADRLVAGRVLIAPGGHHLLAGRRDRLALDDGPEECGVRPSVNVTLESLVRERGPDVVSVILTGMGVDGLRGSQLVHHAGGTVIAQDEPSSVVYGMPRAVAEAGIADEVLPLEEIAAGIERHCRLDRDAARSA